jgi:hypothetical protein
MAIGDNGYSNDSNNNKLYEQTYYSRIRFKNDNMGISINFRAGLLILEMNETDSNYKVTPIISIYLSPTKAHMLSLELKKFKEYIASGKAKENVAFGVNGGMGEKVSYIGFHTNADSEIIVTIGKFDNNGKIIESHDFKFKKDYNYSLEWKNIYEMDIEKVYNNFTELDILINTITDFARFMTGSAGYAAADLTRYDQARVLHKMDPIYDKLGIERRTSGNGGYNRGDNNFLSNATVTSRSTSIEDMGDLLDD